MKNLLEAHQAKIIQVHEYTPDIKLFRLSLVETARKWSFKFNPGQFVLLSILGYGEIALGLASSPETIRSFNVLARAVGTVTNKLLTLKNGDRVNIRGPFGNGFPVKFLDGQDIILAAGGTGLAPLTSLIEYLIIRRKKYGKIYLLYGARDPGSLLFRDQYSRWREKDVEVCLTVDQPDKNWQGNKGLITKLCPKIRVDADKTTAIMVGPPPMYQPLIQEWQALGIPEHEVYISFERRLRCGIGKCQHCTCGEHYVCLDGPVFRYSEVKDQI